jgi:hypothetical protein
MVALLLLLAAGAALLLLAFAALAVVLRLLFWVVLLPFRLLFAILFLPLLLIKALFGGIAFLITGPLFAFAAIVAAVVLAAVFTVPLAPVLLLLFFVWMFTRPQRQALVR